MQDIIADFLKRQEALNSDATHAIRKRDMTDFGEWLDGRDPTELEPITLEEFFLQLMTDGYSSETVNRRFESVRAFYSYCLKANKLSQSPLDELDRSDYVSGEVKKSTEGKRVYVTQDEKDALVQHAPKPKSRNQCIIELMWQTGVRQSELTEIRLEHLNREERTIKVKSKKKQRGDHWRTVHYQPSLNTYLNQWLDVYRPSYSTATNSPYLFVSKQSEQIYPSYVNDHIVRTAADYAGIQQKLEYTDKNGNERNRITSHALRHGHAVHALKSGVDIQSVRKQLGHSDISVTQNYLRYLPDDVGEAYQRF